MMTQLHKGDDVSPFLHPIDAQAWIKLGWSEQKPVSTDPVLSFINSANEPEALEVLPSIGATSARRIFIARPESGYLSFKDVVAVEGLSHVDWDAVKEWSPG